MNAKQKWVFSMACAAGPELTERAIERLSEYFDSLPGTPKICQLTTRTALTFSLDETHPMHKIRKN